MKVGDLVRLLEPRDYLGNTWIPHEDISGIILDFHPFYALVKIKWFNMDGTYIARMPTKQPIPGIFISSSFFPIAAVKVYSESR